MGNKNSGRRIKSVERLRDELTTASYRKALEAVDSPELKLKEQAEIAVKIASKDIGRKLEYTGGIQITLTQEQAQAKKDANDKLEKELE